MLDSWHIVPDGDKIDSSVQVEFAKGDMRIMFNNNLILVCPAEDEDNYFEHCDIMTSAIFCLCCYQIADGETPCRHLLGEYLSKDDAIWFLGYCNCPLTQKSKKELENFIKGDK